LLGQVRLNAPGTIQHVMMKEQGSLRKVINWLYLQEEIARHLGVCTSVITKAIQNAETKNEK